MVLVSGSFLEFQDTEAVGLQIFKVYNNLQNH